MSRIISGLAGSIKLKTAAKSTRPTSDRVKESLFSKLENLGVIEGAKVLDLYAGSGALGLEAASRGASEVVFIERDSSALKCIQENISSVSRALNKGCRLTAVKQDVDLYVRRIAQQYDLYFLDPPYQLATASLESVLHHLENSLKVGALIVCERDKRSDPFRSLPFLKEVFTYAVGETKIWAWSFEGPHHEEPR